MDETTEATGVEPLDVAIELVGGQAALARAIGITQQAVSYWITKGIRVPAEHCAAIERATDGKVTRAALRPDVFGDVIPARETPAAA